MRVHVTGRSAAPLRLLVALLIVTGLLAAAPAACWCPADDHVGQLLHSRFAHEHASDHAPAELGRADAHDAKAHDVADEPAWSSAAGHGLSQWQAGVQMLPPLLAALHVDMGGTRLLFGAVRPAEHIAGPTFPPPR